jgi:hypothetical protein
VTSEAVLIHNISAESLYGYRVSADGETIAGGAFRTSLPARDVNVLRYPIEASGSVLPGVRTVRLTLIDNSPDRLERSFTLPVGYDGTAGG